MTISLIDDNDSPPEFGSILYQKDINETLTIGSTVITVAAHDPDVDPRITYELSDSGGRFSIDNTGM